MHAATPPPPAIVQRVTVRRASARFVFDRRPQRVRAAYVPRAKLHDCASDKAYALPGAAFLVIHFYPARSARRMGPYPTAVKICDFESDVAWAIGLPKKEQFRVSRAGPTVTISFGG